MKDLIANFKNNTPPQPPSTKIEYTKQIPMRDGYLSEIRIHHPAKPSSDARPMFVLIHGGAFAFGNNYVMSSQSRSIAAAHDVTVVNLSYRLAPEHKFPASSDDVWDSVKWLSQVENAKELSCDLSLGFYIGGGSAGANLAAVTTQRWVSEKCIPKISGVWLKIPYLLEPGILPAKYKDYYLAREQNDHALVLNREAMGYVRELYGHDIYSPAFSPFQDKNPHTGMPPVYIQAAGQDPLRDDALIYERALRDHGVPVKLDVYPGVPHGFEGMFPGFKVSRKSVSDMLLGTAWLVGKTVDNELHEKLVDEALAARFRY